MSVITVMAQETLVITPDAPVVQNWTENPVSPWGEEDAFDFPVDLLDPFADQEITGTVRVANTPVDVQAGLLTATFKYTSGNHALVILGVDLLDATDNVVCSDYHYGKAGGALVDNVYELQIAEAGIYTLRYFVYNNLNDSEVAMTNGEITLAYSDGESDGPISDTPVYDGAVGNSDRVIRTVSLKSSLVDESENTITTTGANSYYNLVETDTLSAIAGEELKLNVKMNGGSWMQSYAYIDFDGDGITADVGPEGGEAYEPAEDLVSYSAYQVIGVYYNSAGYLGEENCNTLNLPVFNAPAEPGAYRMRVKTDWNSIDPAGSSQFQQHSGVIVDFILKVVVLNEADNELKTALENAYYAADEVLSEAGYSEKGGVAYELQTTTPDAPGYIWTNAPEASEGPIADLIDGNPNTFFHSRWSSNGSSDDNMAHNLTIDFGAENSISEFAIRFSTRIGAANDYPQEISVQGSNDNANYTEIALLNEGMPKSGGLEYISPAIVADDDYRYIRLVVNKTTTDRIGAGAEHNYFHMAELSIETPFEREVSADEYNYELILDALGVLFDNMNDAWALYEKENATDYEVNSAIETIYSQIAVVNALISTEASEETLAAIEAAKSLIALEGVGYPAAEPRAALQAAIDMATESPRLLYKSLLEDAINDYYATPIEGITMPEDGKLYTFTFITTSGHRNYLEFVANDSVHGLVMKPDTTDYPYSAHAAFKCVDNGDGTYSFKMNDGKYLAMPTQNATSGSDTGYAVEQDASTIVILKKLYLNGSTPQATIADFFGLLAWSNSNGAYLTPNSSGGTYYYGGEPHFHPSWTSAIAIEEWNDTEDNWLTGIEVVETQNSNAANGIYDLSGRSIKAVSAPGIYIVNGKKVLVK